MLITSILMNRVASILIITETSIMISTVTNLVHAYSITISTYLHVELPLSLNNLFSKCDKLSDYFYVHSHND